MLTSAAENGDLLLLKVPAMLFVNQYQVEIVSGRELFVDYDMENIELPLVQGHLSSFFFLVKHKIDFSYHYHL